MPMKKFFARESPNESVTAEIKEPKAQTNLFPHVPTLESHNGIP